MEVRPLGPLMQMLVSNQDLQKDINSLESQMQGLDPNSPEYLYDQLNLELEQEQQRVRAENPNLDPLNPADAKKLDALMEQDPVAQGIRQELAEVRKAFSSEVSGWGIPWYFTKGVPV
jgi:predicted  nucleic acid-binding Zn-ribbon protein